MQTLGVNLEFIGQISSEEECQTLAQRRNARVKPRVDLHLAQRAVLAFARFYSNEASTSKSAKFKLLYLVVLRLSVVQTQRYRIQVSKLRIHRHTDRQTDRLYP